MAGQKITQELVNLLAERISARGEKPTNMAIRKENSDHGSLSYIAPMLKKWNEAKAEEALSDIPEMPLEEMLDSFQPLWIKLTRAAKSEYATQLQDLEFERRTHQENSAEYEAEIDRQAVEIESLREDIEQTKHSHELVYKSLEESRNDSSLLGERCRQLESKIEEQAALINRMQSEREQLTSTIGRVDDNTQAQIEKIEKERDQALDKQDDLEFKINDLEREIIQLNGKADQAEILAQQRQDRIEKMLEENAEYKATNKMLEKQIAANEAPAEPAVKPVRKRAQRKPAVEAAKAKAEQQAIS